MVRSWACSQVLERGRLGHYLQRELSRCSKFQGVRHCHEAKGIWSRAVGGGSLGFGGRGEAGLRHAATRSSGDIANADCLIVAVAHDEFKELASSVLMLSSETSPTKARCFWMLKEYWTRSASRLMEAFGGYEFVYGFERTGAWLEWITGTGCFSCKRFLHLRIAMMFSVEMSMACTIGIF